MAVRHGILARRAMNCRRRFESKRQMLCNGAEGEGLSQRNIQYSGSPAHGAAQDDPGEILDVHMVAHVRAVSEQRYLARFHRVSRKAVRSVAVVRVACAI